MKITISHMAAFVWVWACGDACALTIREWTDAEWIERAERIVIGTLESQGDRSVIRVEEVLKGDALPAVIETRQRPRGKVSPKVLWAGPSSGEKLVSFQGFGPSHYNAHIDYIHENSPRWMLYRSLNNPGMLLVIDGFPECIEAAKMLGYLFDAVKITSPDTPEVAKAMANRGHLPWDYRGVVDLRCRRHPSKTSRLELLATEPTYDGWTNGFLKQTWINESVWNNLADEISIHVDTRPPAVLGTLEYAAAASFLRKRLALPVGALRDRESSYQWRELRVAALSSLRRMRDLDSVPMVISLLGDDDEWVVNTATGFLMDARDARTTQPLCVMLARHAGDTGRRELSDSVCRILGAMGDPQAAPFLEDALAYKMDEAYSALASCGRVESIGAILDSATREGLPNRAGWALFWLAKRSNQKFEPWMDSIRMGRNGPALPVKPRTVAKWKKWWMKHRNQLELVRSFEDASFAWIPPKRRVISPMERHARQHPWMYAAGLGLLLGAGGLGFWLVRRKG